MGRIGAWAREIGPRRLGFGLAAVAAVYLRAGLSLAGYQGSHQPGWIVALPGVAVICAIVSMWKIMPATRVAHFAGLAHGFFLLLAMFFLWSSPLDITGAMTRPQAPADFQIFILPMLALVWATSALMRQGPRDGRG